MKKLLSFVCASLLIFSCACQGSTENGASTDNSVSTSGSADEDGVTSDSGSSDSEVTPPSSEDSSGNGGDSQGGSEGDGSQDGGNGSSGNDEGNEGGETPPSSHEHVAQADDGDCSTPVTCECGETLVEAKTHSFDHNCDLSCNNEGCNHERAVIGHSDKNEDGFCDNCSTKIPANDDEIELPEDKFE